MSSTGPRPNGKSPPFRVNRMRPARDQNQNQNQNQTSQPSQGRVQASGSIDARVAGSSSVNNNSYAYTNVLPSSSPGRSNGRSNGRAQSPTNSGKRSPTSDYGDDGNDSNGGNGGGRNGGNRGNGGFGNDRDRDSRGPNSNGNARQFQHHVSFSFHLGPTGYNDGNRNATGGGLFAGMPAQMPLFGSGFPFGGGGGQRRFGSFSPFRPF